MNASYRNAKVRFLTVVVMATLGIVWGPHAGGRAEAVRKPNAAENAPLYYCPMHPSYTANRPGECPICHMKLVRAELEEVDSKPHGQHKHADPSLTLREFTVEELMAMKPEEVCLLHKCKMGMCMMAMTREAALAGVCPHCGEDLGVTLRNILPEGYSALKLSEEKQHVLGVRTSAVVKTHLTKTVRAVGTVAHDPDLYQAQAEYLQAMSAAREAQKGDIPQITQQAERLVESAKIRLRHLGLDRVLIEEIAQWTEPDQSLLYAGSQQEVWVYAQIYEYELPLVRKGQEVKVEISALPEKPFVGVIRAIDTMVDQVTRTTRVRIQVENKQDVFKPDMYVNVIISVDLGEVLSVSKEAVFDTGARQIVFVDKGGGQYEPRQVRVGSSTQTQYQILEGLREGEQVVTSGNFLIDSESRLKSALQEAAGGGHSGGHAHGS